ETPTKTPTSTPTEVPTETPTEVPTETLTEVPTETLTEVPTETPTEVPTETPTEVPTETPTEPLGVPDPSPTPTSEPIITPTAGPFTPPPTPPEEEPTPTSTPTEPLGVPDPSPTPTRQSETCLISYVNVMVWGGIPVQVDMYVAGELYESKMTAPNAEGEQQATFIIWPAEGQTWDVRVTPHLPAGLDPNQWQFRTIDGSLQTSVKHCENVDLTLQLVNVQPTPAIISLPVTGAAAPPGSLATTVVGLTTMALGLALRARRKDDNAS
ncbi:MAG: hypothetical protein ACOX9A_11625, partial [Anaerolineae bacterium]